MSVNWWLAPHTLRQGGGAVPQWGADGRVPLWGSERHCSDNEGRDLLQSGETSWIMRWQGGGLLHNGGWGRQ